MAEVARDTEIPFHSCSGREIALEAKKALQRHRMDEQKFSVQEPTPVGDGYRLEVCLLDKHSTP